MARKAKNPSSGRYFTHITEMAINAYNKCDNDVLKNKIYNRFIKYPLDKLAENVIHTYKTYYFDEPYEDVKASVVAFLNEKMHKFKGDRGKAFSYFTVIARNFLFNENNANYAKMKVHEKLDAVDLGRNVSNEVYERNYLEDKSDFMDFYVDYIDTNLNKIFLRDRDRKVADSVNELFRTRKDLYSYNKKALYILIRDRTGVNTQYITKVIGKMKVMFAELNTDYSKAGILKLNHNIERYYDEGR
jgi:hypothetical protein